MKKINAAILGFSILSLIFTSCKKDNKEVDNELQSTIDNALCEQEFMRIFPAVNELALTSQGVVSSVQSTGSQGLLTCYTYLLTGDTTATDGVTFDSTNNLPTITLDWGTGCYDSIDKVFRSGKLKCIFNKRYNTVGSQVNIVAENYKVDNNSYSGTMRVTRIATGANSSFRIEVMSGKCTNTQWSIDWECDKTVTWKQGYDTPSNLNDVIEITGNSSGKNREQRKFTSTITSALVKRSWHKHIVMGTLKITPEGLEERMVDFGDGTEDNIGTFTVNGNTFTFTMQ